MWEIIRIYREIYLSCYNQDITRTTKLMTKKKEQTIKQDFDKSKTYPLEEAIDILQSLSKTKFDATVEAHFRLGIDPRKGDQQIRTTVSLPHGTGKTVRVAAFVNPENEDVAKEAGADLVGGEDLIAKIKKTEKTEFQVAVAEPSIMRNLSQIAKILGTRGLMPSPKSDTVTNDIATTVKELKKGKVSFKNDDTANIHLSIGKISFTKKQLAENFNAVLNVIKKAKPQKSKGIYLKNIVLSSTMGPGIKVEIN